MTTPQTPDIDLLSLPLRGLETWIEEIGERSFRARQLFRWMHARGVRDFAAMSDLAKPLREALAARARMAGLTLERVLEDPDDGTQKLLLTTTDGHLVESVLIPMEGGVTQCVSTQIGCRMRCAFCLTGTRGRTRNLSAGEIVDQVTIARRVLAGGDEKGVEPLHPGPRHEPGNLVFMGMGEPLDNYDATVSALRILLDAAGHAFSPRRITVSTLGLVPEIERLGNEPELGVNLAVSLNATTDELRREIMPGVRRYPLETLFAALRAFPLPPRRRITLEYVVLAGLNDRPEDARRLIRLVHGLRCKVNLIPFNPWDGAPYRRPEPAALTQFLERLRRSDVTVTIRDSRGATVGAACGQLG